MRRARRAHAVRQQRFRAIASIPSRELLQSLPLRTCPGNVDNWQGSVSEHVDYWNVSQRVDVNITDKLKVFARYGQFKANLYQNNPVDGGSSRSPAATATA
jgi:hypothetical protein